MKITKKIALSDHAKRQEGKFWEIMRSARLGKQGLMCKK